MKCEQCGTENLEGSSFCKKCGKKLKEEEKTGNTSETQSVNESSYKNENNINNSLAVYCQCGQKLEPNWKFCPKCKTPITIEIKNTTNVEQNQNIKDRNENLYIAIFAISIACSYFLQLPGGFLVAIITIITGKIKCPNNRAIKVLFWLTILFTILYVIFIMWLIIVCSNSLRSCPG